ncbi:YrdB family protein [Pseudarthrobacter sp. P1]|uniref:YrdB family protein n=1 Tax=Pseudarthrobacter sp. P1 TaxID=3418418 RepID=UPI003CE9E587
MATMAVGFALEVAMLAAICAWGFRQDAPWNYVLGVGLPAVVIILWGYFMAPKAQRRLPWPALPAVSLLAFLLAAGVLVAAHLAPLGALLAGISLAYTASCLYLRRSGARV